MVCQQRGFRIGNQQGQQIQQLEVNIRFLNQF